MPHLFHLKPILSLFRPFEMEISTHFNPSLSNDMKPWPRFIMTAGERRQEAGGEDVKDITGLQLPSSVFGASRCDAAQCRGCKNIVIYSSGERRRQWVSSSRPHPGVSTLQLVTESLSPSFSSISQPRMHQFEKSQCPSSRGGPEDSKTPPTCEVWIICGQVMAI